MAQDSAKSNVLLKKRRLILRDMLLFDVIIRKIFGFRVDFRSVLSHNTYECLTRVSITEEFRHPPERPGTTGGGV